MLSAVLWKAVKRIEKNLIIFLVITGRLNIGGSRRINSMSIHKRRRNEGKRRVATMLEEKTALKCALVFCILFILERVVC